MTILFIGNSYTSGIRQQFDALIAAAGLAAETAYICPGGWRLKQHLAQADTVETIRTGDWDYVVLQEQSKLPSYKPAGRKGFDDGVATFAARVDEAGAKLILYMTWGRRDGDKQTHRLNPDYSTMQDRLSAAYREAASANGATIAPAGEAWRRIHDEHPELFRTLYVDDGSHPSTLGGYLTALVFMRVIFDQDLDALARPESIDDTAWTAIIAAANNAVSAEQERAK